MPPLLVALAASAAAALATKSCPHHAAVHSGGGVQRCACLPDYFMLDASSCVPCSTLHRSRAFPGTNCSYVGATLAEMPVRSGFYRDGEMALSVLRCEPLKACKGAGAQRAEGHLNGLHKS